MRGKKRGGKAPRIDQMNTHQLAEATAIYDTEMVIDKFGPLTDRAKARWKEAQRKPGRPKRGEGAQVISITVESGLLTLADNLARESGFSRARLVERGLKAVIAAEEAEKTPAQIGASETTILKERLPRLTSLYERTLSTNQQNYFIRLSRELHHEPVLEAMVPYERLLERLDAEARDRMSRKAGPHVHRPDPDRGYEQFINALDEGWGYLYLESLGYEPHFIPEGSTPRPDFCGHKGMERALLEVKSLGVSALEVAYWRAVKLDPTKLEARDATLDPQQEAGNRGTLISRLDKLISKSIDRQLAWEGECGSVKERILLVIVRSDIRFTVSPTSRERLEKYVQQCYRSVNRVVVETWPQIQRLLD